MLDQGRDLHCEVMLMRHLRDAEGGISQHRSSVAVQSKSPDMGSPGARWSRPTLDGTSLWHRVCAVSHTQRHPVKCSETEISSSAAMGRRKPFIDKKSATTYSLLYTDADETGDDEAPSTASQDVGAVTSRPDHRVIVAELQGWQDEAPIVQVPHERRREIVDLGFPDDGYDYLKHLKGSADEGQGLKDDSPSAGRKACPIWPTERTVSGTSHL